MFALIVAYLYSKDEFIIFAEIIKKINEYYENMSLYDCIVARIAHELFDTILKVG